MIRSAFQFPWRRCFLLIAGIGLCGLLTAPAKGGAPADYFEISVVDDATGRGIPLVELRTVHKVSYWTDSNGLVAFHEPALMGREVYLHVSSPGYEVPADGFGFRGYRLTPSLGGKFVLRLKRSNIAERLYRVTGAGIYRDTTLLGKRAPTQHPLLNGLVLGQDTVVATPYRGKIHWFWGDTDRLSYPLGNYGASGATSLPPGGDGLDPGVGVNLDYFVDAKGFSRPMCPGFGRGLHWIESVMTIVDTDGTEKMVARVSSQEGLQPAYAWHLAIWNDARNEFDRKVTWYRRDGHDSAHPFRASVGGREYIYLYPNYRVPADLESLSDLNRYEAYTCLTHGPNEEIRVERDEAGQPVYAWRRGADRLHTGRLRDAIASGALKPEERWLRLVDVESGAVLPDGRGSVFWNEFLQRWVMIVSGATGEIWFAAADTPVGPWGYARRVVTHGDYNFYNPTQHPFFDQEKGRIIHFEGTYTAAFSAAKTETPRYDYNQLMYRLSLDDPRLSLPVPVYRVRGADGGERLLTRSQVVKENRWKDVMAVAFFAVSPERPVAGLVPIYAVANGGLASTPAQPGDAPLFLAMPAAPIAENQASLPSEANANLVPLREVRSAGSGLSTSTVTVESSKSDPSATGSILCHVWRNASAVLTLDPGAVPLHPAR